MSEGPQKYFVAALPAVDVAKDDSDRCAMFDDLQSNVVDESGIETQYISELTPSFVHSLRALSLFGSLASS